MAQGIISSEQPAAMGIHYHYYSLRYMLESQKRAGYQSIRTLLRGSPCTPDDRGGSRPGGGHKCGSGFGIAGGLCYP